LGDQHPLAQLLRLMLLMDQRDTEIYVQLMKCEIGVLENRAGVLQSATIFAQQALIYIIASADTSEGVMQVRVLYAACGKSLTQGYDKWVIVSLNFAQILTKGCRYHEARDILLGLLQDAAPPNVYIHDMKPHILYALSNDLFGWVIWQEQRNTVVSTSRTRNSGESGTNRTKNCS